MVSFVSDFIKAQNKAKRSFWNLLRDCKSKCKNRAPCLNSNLFNILINILLQLDSLYLELDKVIIRTKKENCLRQWEFKLSNMMLHRFCSEWTSEIVWPVTWLSKGLYGVWLFKCLSYRELQIHVGIQQMPT